MRIIVYFDLPVETTENRRQYSTFRRYLISQGFIMIQKSVYSKIAMNASAADTVKTNLRANRPKSGNVMVLSISERQFQNMEVLVGERQNEIIDTLDRFVVL